MIHALSRLSSACQFLSRFPRDERANVAPIFAIAVIPILGLTGTAVDYSNANAARTAMQAALDTTALMLSKEANGLTQDQLNAKATQYFDCQYHATSKRRTSSSPRSSAPRRQETSCSAFRRVRQSTSVS